MILSVNLPPEGRITVDLRAAATQMTAKEQKRLFQRIGPYLSDLDCQRALDDLAEAIVESRTQAARQILDGDWPVTRPVSVQVLKRFYDAQLPIVLSVCRKPEILVKYESASFS